MMSSDYKEPRVESQSCLEACLRLVRAHQAANEDNLRHRMVCHIQDLSDSENLQRVSHDLVDIDNRKSLPPEITIFIVVRNIDTR